MSNHFSADKLKFPGDDRRLDLTDVFVFPAPAGPEHHHTLLHRHRPGTTVLIMDSNPTSAPPPIPVTGPEFYPGAIYRINIDTDGDNHADVAFTFSEYENGKQTGTAWRREEPVQLPPARRRRSQLPGTVVGDPAKRRPRAARRPAGRVSLPRPPEPLATQGRFSPRQLPGRSSPWDAPIPLLTDPAPPAAPGTSTRSSLVTWASSVAVRPAVRRPAASWSGLQEGQQVSVDRRGLGGRHAVRESFVCLERPVLHEPC
jgi:Domain of unknown function (DUF4331)